MSDIPASRGVGKGKQGLLPGPWTLTHGWTWEMAEAVMTGDVAARVGEIVAAHMPEWQPDMRITLNDAALDAVIHFLNHKFAVLARARDGKTVTLVDLARGRLIGRRTMSGTIESQLLDMMLQNYIAVQKKNEKTGADIIVTLVQEWIATRMSQTPILRIDTIGYRPDQPWPYYDDTDTDERMFNLFRPATWFVQAQRALERGGLPDRSAEAAELIGHFHDAFFRTDAEERYWTRLLGFKYLTPAAEVPLCIFEAVRDDGSQLFGVGRGTYFSVMGHMVFGESNTMPVSLRQLGSQFNTFEQHVFVEVPELPPKDGHGRAKGLHDVTADRLRQTIDPSIGRMVGREAKGADVATALRCKMMVACTNYETALHIEDGDRRIWIARCAKKVDDAARAAMEAVRQMNDAAMMAAMVRWYQDRAFASADEALSAPPMTTAKRQAVLDGIEDWEDIYITALEDREALPYPILTWPQVEMSMRLNASAHDKRHVASPEGVRANDRAEMLTLSRAALNAAKARFFKTALLPTEQMKQERYDVARTLSLRGLSRMISSQVPVANQLTAYCNPHATQDEQTEALRLMAAPASEEKNTKVRTHERLRVVEMVAKNDDALEKKRHAVLKWLDAGCPPESHLKLVPKQE